MLPCAALFLMASVFVALRLKVAAHGNASFFVQAGADRVDPARAPHGLFVAHGVGYDGQFYYRFALEPWNLSRVSHGITLDSALRRERILYSALAWVVSLGHASWTPAALIVVNVVALAAVGFLAGRWAQALGRHAVWGLLPAGFFGLVWSLSRDLTEIVAIAFLLAGLLAIRHERFLIAGLALSGSVLTRESMLVVIGAYMAVRAVDIVRRRERVGLADVVWALPLASFVALQAICLWGYGSVPASAGAGNVGAPLVAMVRAVSQWIRDPSRNNMLQLLQLGVFAAVVLAAFWHLRASRASTFERVAFVFTLLVVLSFSASVWNGDPMEFRLLAEAFVLGSGVVLGARSLRLTYLMSATWLVWLVAAALRIKAA